MSPSTAAGTAAAPAPTSSPSEPGSVPRRTALLLVALIAAGFLAVIATHADAPFGDSYEGRNGGVWGAGSQAILHDGPIESALGARHESGLVYARHPPLIYPLTATAELVLGSRPAVTRLPSILSALATIALLYRLLRTTGLRRLSSVAGVAVASSTAMFTVYGPMPDTPMLGLPIGLGLVIAWLRRRQGRPLPVTAEFALAVAAALTAWQAVFAALLIGALEAFAATPVKNGLQPVRRARAAGSWLGGTAVGLALTLAWVVWASGGPGHLVDALTERSGAEGGIDGATTISAQLSALVDLFGIAVLGLVAVVIALRSARWRAPAGVLLAVVFGYAVLTPDAAAVHDYWLYWAVAPIALGWALVADTALDARRTTGDHLAVVGVCALAVALMALGWSSSSAAEQSFVAGLPAGRLIQVAELPDDQERLPTIGVVNQFAAWITLSTGADTGGLDGPAELERMAAVAPDHLVLASTWCPPADDGLCEAVTGGGGTRVDHDYVLLTAAAARERLAAP